MFRKRYCVVDIGDMFVLFSGSKRECQQVQEQNYAGLVLLREDEVPDNYMNYTVNRQKTKGRI